MYRKLIYLLLPALITACQVFMAEDITGITPQLLAPNDGINSTLNQMRFSWEPVDGATGYRLQVTQPDFSLSGNILVDSVFSEEQATIILSPGAYQWRVRAENNAYQSQWSEIRTLVMDTATDLNGQVIQLSSPTDVSYSMTAPTLSWLAHPSVTQYLVEVRAGTTWTSGSFADSIHTTGTNWSGATLSEGNYVWKVSGTGLIPGTAASAEWSFGVDQTAPGVPSLINPADLATLTDTVDFSWTSGTNTGTVLSPTQDSLYVYMGSVSSANLIYTDVTSSAVSQEVFSNAGTYIWFVKTFDAAGNVSGQSAQRSFDIQ